MNVDVGTTSISPRNLTVTGQSCEYGIIAAGETIGKTLPGRGATLLDGRTPKTLDVAGLATSHSHNRPNEEEMVFLSTPEVSFMHDVANSDSFNQPEEAAPAPVTVFNLD